jgi:hypothetical protein
MNRPPTDRSLFWNMVVACFTAVLACLGARAAVSVSAVELRAQQDYMIVRVRAPEDESGLHRAAAVLVGARLRAEVEVMSPARAAALLSGGGGDVDPAALAPLRLIEVRLPAELSATPVLARELTGLMEDAGVAADIVLPRQDAPAGGVDRMSRAALWTAGFLSLGMALIIALSARAIASRRSDFIAVLADLGEPRGAAVQRLTDEAGAAAFVAGALGAGFAAVAAAVAARFALATPDLAAIFAHVRPVDGAIALAAPFLASLAAGTGAWLSAGARYSRAARLR